MDYESYNAFCLTTSIIVLLLILFKVNIITFGIIVLISALFSIIWRSTKLIQGKNKIEKNGTYRSNPLFILDFGFAILAFICIFYTKQINRKLFAITFFVFVLAWLLYYMEMTRTARVLHTCGHCYVIVLIILTFYLYIN